MNKITHGFFRSKSKSTIKTGLILFILLLLNMQTSWGQISITGVGVPNTYAQDFNLLANTGTNIAITTLPLGWTFIETLSNANTTFDAGDGSSNTANTFSFGTGTATERAFGVQRSNNLGSTMGVSFTNNSGIVISELVISYTGEQWRLGTISRPDRLDFQYSVDATSLITGVWTDLNSLDFIAPLTSGTLGAKDGNLAANRSSISNSITGLSISPGATFWLRFNDFDTTGAEDALAVDDFSMYAIATPVITLSASTLIDFSATPTAPSSAQTINVSASNLTANLNVVPSANFEVSLFPTTGFGSSIPLAPSSGAVASTPIYVRLKSGVALGPLSEAVTFTSTGAATQSLTCTGGVYTNYYYNGSGLLTDAASWDTDTDGIGTNPPVNFTDASQLFEIRNTTAVALVGAWTVGTDPSNGTKVRLGNNSEAAVTLTLNSGASIDPSGSGNFDVANPSSGNQTIIYKGITAISFGSIFDNNLAVIYDAVTQSSASTKSFGTVSLINGATVTFSATPVIKNINVDATSIFEAPTTASSFITIPSGGSLTVNGTIRIPRFSGFVSNGLGTPNTTATGTNIQFLGAEILTLGANSTVEYVRTAAGTQTVSARTDYKNLTLTGTAPKVLSGNTTVAGNLTINTATGLPTGANTLTLGGVTSGAGFINTGASGTLVYNGSAAQTVSNLTAGTANNLTIDNSAGVTIGANTAVNNALTISSGSLTVLSGINLTVTNGIVNNGTLTIQNNANLRQVNDVANTGSGNTIVNRNSNPLFRLDFTLWSSPVSGSQTLAQFSPVTSLNRFYTYDASFAPNGRYKEVSAPTATPFAAGTGYLIRMPNENVLAGYNGGTSNLTYNGVFTGTPNNGNVSITSLSSDSFYAVGNPYPSTISANAFINGNSTDGTLYFWRKKNEGLGSAYASYNLVGSTVTAAASGNGSSVPDGTIAVGQGFIVKTGATATTLNFTNTMRTANNSALFFKTKQVAQKNRIWLNLTNTTGAFSQALVVYVDGATLGVDNGIDGKYINDSEIALTSNINNEEYTIQGRPAFDVADVVALNFKTDIAGDYTIAIDHTDGLFASGQDIYLVDSKTGTETNLKEGGYNFTAAKGVDNARFSLKYQKTLKIDASELNNNSVQVYKNNGTLYISATGKSISNIKVYDVQGRLIAEQKSVKSNTATISNLKADNQVLIVRVTGEDNSEVTKKVLN